MKSVARFEYKFDFIAIEIDFLSLIPFLNFGQRIRMIKEARDALRNFHSSGYQLVECENFNFFWVSNESEIRSR